MKNECTCIIPFFNEGERVLRTVQVFSTIPNISRIICVDDGSEDNASSKLKAHFPGVDIIRLNTNTGKSDAIYEGLQKVKTSHVLLFDADLSNIKKDEIRNALTTILSDSSIDMIVLRRIVDSRFLSYIRHDILMSGQRILRTADLKKVFMSNPKDYQIEMAINKYMLDNTKRVYWMPLSTINPRKIVKMGFIKSLKFYFSMFFGFFTYSGIDGYLAQVFNFCKEEAK